MSRRIVVKSEIIEETDLAAEVVKELEESNIYSLSFNHEKHCFENSQYDDIADNTIKRALDLYYQKRKARNTQRVTEALKKSKYNIKQTEIKGKTKIIAVQRVYA